MPTSSPVKVLGFEIDGRRGTIRLPCDSQLSLIRSTLSALRSYEMTGRQLAHLIGRWTWVMMLRRPTLAVLQHVIGSVVYRTVDVFMFGQVYGVNSVCCSRYCLC